jgi:hypothetical protein
MDQRTAVGARPQPPSPRRGPIGRAAIPTAARSARHEALVTRIQPPCGGIGLPSVTHHRRRLARPASQITAITHPDGVHEPRRAAYGGAVRINRIDSGEVAGSSSGSSGVGQGADVDLRHVTGAGPTEHRLERQTPRSIGRECLSVGRSATRRTRTTHRRHPAGCHNRTSHSTAAGHGRRRPRRLRPRDGCRAPVPGDLVIVKERGPRAPGARNNARNPAGLRAGTTASSPNNELAQLV